MVSDTKFSYKSHLQEHMQMHTQGNYVGCDICGSKILDITISKRRIFTLKQNNSAGIFVS